MPDLRPGAASIADLFGSIQSGVAAHLSTADLWGHLRDAAAAAGRDISGVNAIDVGQLRSLAAGLRNSVDAFAALPSNYAISADSVAQNVYSRSLAAQSLAPTYHVRFSLNTSSGGLSSSQSMTWIVAGQLPATKGDLVDQLMAYGQALAEQGSSQVQFGSSLDSISGIEISAV